MKNVTIQSKKTKKIISVIRVILCLLIIYTTRIPLPESNSGSGLKNLEVSEETIWGILKIGLQSFKTVILMTYHLIIPAPEFDSGAEKRIK